MRQETIDLLIRHDKTIWAIAHKMATYLNYQDVDELYSRGKEALVAKMHKYDSNKGKFSTFAYIVLRNDLIDFVERNRKLVPSSSVTVNGERSDPMMNIPDERQSDSLPSRLSDIHDGASEAMKEVIDICLTMNLGDVFHTKPPIEKVRAELIRRGWDRRKTHEVFYAIAEEIKAW